MESDGRNGLQPPRLSPAASSTPATAALGASAGLAASLAAFWRVAGRWPGVPPPGSSATRLAAAVARAGAAGAVVVGALSGYGAVALPRANLAAFVKPVTARDVAAVEGQLVRTVELAARKRRAAALAARAARSRGGGAAAAPSHPWLSFLPTSSGAASTALAAADEARALDGLARELAGDALAARADAARARAARTLAGRARNALGYALSAYCVVRVFASARDLVAPPPPGAAADPAARALGAALAALTRGRLGLSSADASHYVAVAFVGAVGVGSLNGFLRACRRALAAASGAARGSAAPAAAALALSEVLGLYALSTLLLTMRRLPPEPAAAVAAALGGGVDGGPLFHTFNVTFLLAATLTVAGLAASRAVAEPAVGAMLGAGGASAAWS